MKPKSTTCARCHREVYLADARVQMYNGRLQWVCSDLVVCNGVGLR